MLIDTIKMLPLFILENATMKELLSAEKEELNRLEKHIESIREELNILSADKLLSRYEKIYDKKTLGDNNKRRIDIVTKKLSRYHANVNNLTHVASFITGSKCEIIENNNEYQFKIIIHDFSTYKQDTLMELIKKMEELKPCHLACKTVSRNNKDITIQAYLANFLKNKIVVYPKKQDIHISKIIYLTDHTNWSNTLVVLPK